MLEPSRRWPTISSHRARARLGPLIVALLVASAIAALGPVAAKAAPPATAVGRSVASVTFRPDIVPMSAPEIANPGRGQTAWQGIAPKPEGWPAADVYYRDHVYWGKLEKERGTYDFSSIDAGLAQAEAQGGLFSFRVMAWCPGCWMEYSTDPNKPSATPTWMPRQDGGWRPPRWNSAAFLDAWDDLMAALGKRYGDDPRIGWIDIGGYGAYGEWHVTEGTSITVDNAVRMAKAVLRAFPDNPILVNAMIPDLVLPVLRLSPRIGWRHDCLGAEGFGWFTDQYPVVRDRWKTAPVSSEWCHSADTSTRTGLDQVEEQHVSSGGSDNLAVTYADMTAAEKEGFRNAAKSAGYRYEWRSVTVPSTINRGDPEAVDAEIANVGSAPVYRDWQVRLGLADPASGKVVSTAILPVDLGAVLPGVRTVDAEVTFPASTPTGGYQLLLQVRDPTGYADPMRLPIVGRQAGGWYPLGPVAVAN